MSETTATTKPILPVDSLPILPEIHPIEPIVQCGVLYLGTAPCGAGLRGLDAIQEPFSHRYPVDGTNTVRGIDAILSIYDNGIQLAFTRQPHAALFFPITSLIYCATLRFSIIENDQTKSTSLIDWRFMPLETLTINANKHPPLFCAVTQRTQILPGDECHCFITKSSDAAFTLVQTISHVYANLIPGTKCLKSPIFYQLDRFGRKLSETTGIIYISPANDDDSQLNRINPNQLRDESITRHCLFDPSWNGFFYRTDASLIEQWQLWDDDNLIGSRPHPPASPFGLYEGLYHDDTTQEVQRYLRHMDDEEHSCSCTCSSKSSSSASSASTEYSRRQNRHHSNKQNSASDTDQFNASFSNLQTSSFEPVLTQNNFRKKKKRQKPIIIEKVVPKPTLPIPILNPQLPQQPLDLSNSLQESNINCIPLSDFSSIPYQINERGEKITKEGNRIIYTDVVQLNTNKNPIDSQSYIPSTSRSHRQRSSRHIPVIDIKSIERLFDEKNSKNQRHTSINTDDKLKDHPNNNTNYLTTSDMLGAIEDYHGHKIKSNNHTTQSTSNHFESSSKKKQRQKNSIISSTNSSKNGTRRRHSHSTLTAGPSVNYGERPSIPILSPSQTPSSVKQKPPTPPVLTNEKLNEYVSNIYGAARSVKSNSSSTSHQEIKPIDNTAVINAAYISAFRYVQSNIDPHLLRQYRNAY